MRRASETGVGWSCSPTMTRVGQWIDERRGTESGRPAIAIRSPARPLSSIRAIIVSTLDNLVKGASGQAVQNMNVMLGYPEGLGLEQIALFP